MWMKQWVVMMLVFLRFIILAKPRIFPIIYQAPFVFTVMHNFHRNSFRQIIVTHVWMILLLLFLWVSYKIKIDLLFLFHFKISLRPLTALLHLHRLIHKSVVPIFCKFEANRTHCCWYFMSFFFIRIKTV